MARAECDASPGTRSVAVIGGGISGLAAAHRLRELSPNVRIKLYEAAGRLGGVLETTREQGFLLEHSADNFITNPPYAIDLCRRLGIEDELVGTNPRFRGAEVVRGGRLYPVPEGFVLMAPHNAWALLRSPLLSFRGKLRLLAECLVRRRHADVTDESLADFAVRRLGREAFERLVQPLVGGIYTADAARLSMAAALPRFWEDESRDGSLMRAAFRRRANNKESMESGARYSLFMAPRAGMKRLVEALAASLPPDVVRCNAAIDSLTPSDGRWRLVLVSGERAVHDVVVISTPAPKAAELVRGFDDTLARLLAEIPYAGTTLALMGYRQEQLREPLRSFGFVVPEIERRNILAASFSSMKYPGRAPEGYVLLRVFLGGAKRTDLLQLDDAQVKQVVERELADLLGIQGEPALFRVLRWNSAMPQYHVGHETRVAEIESRVQSWPGLALAGNAYHGVGIPQCIASGETAAERTLELLDSQSDVVPAH